MHALTALNRNGHTSTGHEQRHDGEEGRARCAGQRQLGDGLHVLHGLVSGVDQAPRIGNAGPKQNSVAIFEAHGEARIDVKIDVASTLSFRDGVGLGGIKTGEGQFAAGVSLNLGRCVRGIGGNSLLVRTVLLHEIQYGVTLLHLESDVLDALAVRIDLGEV